MKTRPSRGTTTFKTLQISPKICKSHLHSKETNDSFSVGVWPKDPSGHLLLLDRAPNLAHPCSLILDEGVEEYDGEGKEKVEEQPDVDEGHLRRGERYDFYLVDDL